MKGSMFSYREFTYGSLEYAASVQLRQKVLRDPLGFTFTTADLEPDRNDIHLGGFEGDVIVASLILTRISPDEIKMRQVAVDPKNQGKGVGLELIKLSEKKAAELGARTMALNARETAIPFYERAGYEIFGEPNVAVTLPHRFMRKTLVL